MGYRTSLPSEVYIYIEDVYVYPNEAIAEPVIEKSKKKSKKGKSSTAARQF